MEKVIIELSFHLRKPYNEAEKLIEVFNQILEEGGRCEICIPTLSSDGHILQVNMYRCRNSYIAASMGAKITDLLTTDTLLKISKINFANTFYCPTRISIKNSDNKNYGPIITFSLFEHNEIKKQKMIHQNFEIIDSTSTSS